MKPSRQNDVSPDTNQLYAWLSRDQDGVEGLVTTYLGGVLMPLVMADEQRAREFASIAAQAARLRGFPARLVAFERCEGDLMVVDGSDAPRQATRPPDGTIPVAYPEPG